MDPAGDSTDRSKDRSPRRVDPPPSRRVTLQDGTSLVIRAMEPSDRRALALGYERLSEQSRRRRFFSAPTRLSEALLDYLTDVDFDHHVALVAHLPEDDEPSGLGVARWIRDDDDPTEADAAITVADDWQGRGIGTELLVALVESAVERGVATFVADVLWDNRPVLDALQALGARVARGEPGVARLEIDLPAPGTELDGTAVHRMLVEAARASS